MPPRQRAIVVAGLIAVAILALGVLAIVGGVGTPSISVDPGGHSLTATDPVAIQSTVTVENPLPVGWPESMATLTHTLSLNGLAVGTVTASGIASGTTTFTPKTRLDTALDRWWPRFLGANETLTLRSSATASVGIDPVRSSVRDAVNVSTLTGVRPFEQVVQQAAQEIPGEYGAASGTVSERLVSLALEGVDVSVGTASEYETELRLGYSIRNRGELAVPAIPRVVNLTLRGADHEVLVLRATPATDRGTHMLGPGDGDDLAVTLAATTAEPTAWLRRHLASGESSELTARLEIRFELPTQGIEIVAPGTPPANATCTLRTDLLTDQPDGLGECT